MSFARNYQTKGETLPDGSWSSFSRHNFNSHNIDRSWNNNHIRKYINIDDFPGRYREYDNYSNNAQSIGAPLLKRRKFSSSTRGEQGRHKLPPHLYENSAPSNGNYVPPPTRSDGDVSTSTSCKRDRSIFEDDEPTFMSRDEIEKYSPSRKDGIDALRETHLRYSYCAFLQDLGMRLELPQTTTGTAMILCHRFFVRRSHACHDRFLIATAALFLAAKSEETPRPLNNVVRASCEILYKQNISFLSYMLPVDWSDRYRERVTEAETMILTTLNFELNVQHPYDSLSSALDKLGLSQTVLVNLALNLVSEGWLRSSLWLQFKPHQIAAGAAYLAAKFLNWDLATCHSILQEFQTTPAILQDVSDQLMELLYDDKKNTASLGFVDQSYTSGLCVF